MKGLRPTSRLKTACSIPVVFIDHRQHRRRQRSRHKEISFVPWSGTAVRVCASDQLELVMDGAEPSGVILKIVPRL